MLLAVGVTYRLTSAEAIAELGLRKAAVVTSLTGPDSPVGGVVGLATCNRFELYVETQSFPDAVDAALSALSSATPAHLDDVEDGFTVWAGRDAAAHLFEVTAGLDSMVLGENEITGQVRTAFRDAHATLTPALTRVGAAALASARTAARATDRSTAAPSVASAGLDLVLPAGANPATLVLGTGRFAHVVVTDLLRRGVTAITVFSRTGRAEGFARTHPVTPVAPDGLAAAVADADLVVGCGGYREAVLTPGLLTHRDRPITLLDLTGGADVDPTLGTLDTVRLVTLDDVGQGAASPATAAVEGVRACVESAVDSYLADEQGRTAAATVTTLRDHVAALAGAELRAVATRYPPETVEAVARSLRRVTGSLLHEPTVRATAAARAGELADYQRALRTVFGVAVEP